MSQKLEVKIACS